jgi:hypothetical protein
MNSQEKPTGKQLVTMKNQIVSGFKDSNWRELGALTETLDMIQGHSRLLRSLSWGDEDYDGHVLTVLKDMIDADPQNYAIIRDYLSRHCPETGEFVSSHDEDLRKITFTPTAFKIPDKNPNPDLISVMMPFEAAMNSVYEKIQSAAKATGFACKRADDIWDDSTVIQDVFSLIFESYIVVCDFSGRNANVFYEAGIAHTLGKHVVPITQNPDDIPFDLRHHRYARYLNNNEGREALQNELETRFQTLSTKRKRLLWS